MLYFDGSRKISEGTTVALCC